MVLFWGWFPGVVLGLALFSVLAMLWFLSRAGGAGKPAAQALAPPTPGHSIEPMCIEQMDTRCSACARTSVPR
jgi:hypothetical protein